MSSVIQRLAPRLAAAGLLASLSAPAVQAEVLHAAETGFVVRHERTVLAPPETAWRMLLGHVGEWWHPDHTYSGNAESLYIEARPLGCFCEHIGPNDVVVHLTVTMLRENKLLRLTGGLGPLGLMGVDGNLTVSLLPSEDATNVALEYRVGGYDPDGLERIAPAVDSVLGEQMDRFVRFVESGSPDDSIPEDVMPGPEMDSPADVATDAPATEG
ncbi:MAG: ATPase [Pseudomonadota bacterium]